jgi:hypothetical protein
MGVRNCKKSVIAVSLISLIQPLAPLAAQAKPESNEGTAVDRLSSGSIEERRIAAKEVEEEYSRLVDELLEKAKSTRVSADLDYDSAWALSVKLLGVLRARAAVPYLVSEIGTTVPTVSLEGSSISGHPCAVALIQIGMPAAEALAWRAAKPTSIIEKIIISDTLTSILSDKFAIERLEEKSRASYSDGRKNLMEIIEIIRDDTKMIELMKELQRQDPMNKRSDEKRP